MTELLTEAEQEAIEMAGRLYDHIVQKVIVDGPTREHDCNELVADIHRIQHTVMAQAAARAYPNKYRVLGGMVGKVWLGDQ